MLGTRKWVFAALLLLLMGVGKIAAQSGDFRLGLEFGQPSAVLIVRPAPFDFRVGYNFGQSGQFLFLAADYRIVDSYRLIDFLHLFVGAGLYSQVLFSPGSFQFGARIPFGLQVFLIDGVFEFFAEVAPVVQFVPSIDFDITGVQGGVGFTVRVPKFWK